MRIARRLIGVILLTSLSATPLGVAAEGYVCATSGARMSHQSIAVCPHCGPAKAAAKATFERPCCVYVGATALPPVLSVASLALVAPARVATVVPPTVTALAPTALPLGTPEYDADGPSPPLTLVQSVQLKN